jgi:hypothetical protein
MSQKERSDGSEQPTYSEKHIFIPDRCPLEVDLMQGDILTITFTETVYLWNSDPIEFDPPLEIDFYQRGTTWSGLATRPEDVLLGWLAFVPGPQAVAAISHQEVELLTVKPKRALSRGVSPCTIHVGSGGPG